MKDIWEIGSKGVCFFMGHDFHRQDDNCTWRCGVCGEVRNRKP